MAHVQLANGFILSDPEQLTQALATAPKPQIRRMIDLDVLLKTVVEVKMDWLCEKPDLTTVQVTAREMFMEINSIIAIAAGMEIEDLLRTARYQLLDNGDLCLRFRK